MRTKDHNDYPSKIYKVEYSRMFIEILDNDHIHGKPHYFGSPRLRDDFINNIKEHILRINLEELLQIQVCRNIFLTFPILQAFQPIH